jgi:hypothetical protein
MKNFLKDKKFWYIITALLVVIGGIVLFVIYKRKKAAEALALGTSTAGTAKTNGTAAPASTTMYNASAFPLTYGSRGNEVLKLQKYLNNGVLANQTMNGIVAPLAKLVEDGIWGVKTDEAIKVKLGLSSIDETYYKKIVLGI